MMKIVFYILLSFCCVATKAQICFVEEGKMYPGLTVKQFQNVKSYESCRSMCRDLPDSQAFVWRGPDSAKAGQLKCNCKEGLGDGEDKPGIYSGNTKCQGGY